LAEQYSKFWEERFDALEIYLNKLQNKIKDKSKKMIKIKLKSKTK